GWGRCGRGGRRRREGAGVANGPAERRCPAILRRCGAEDNAVGRGCAGERDRGAAAVCGNREPGRDSEGPERRRDTEASRRCGRGRWRRRAGNGAGRREGRGEERGGAGERRGGGGGGGVGGRGG